MSDPIFRPSDPSFRRFVPHATWPRLVDHNDIECHVKGEGFTWSRCPECNCGCGELAHYPWPVDRHEDSCYDLVAGPHRDHEKTVIIGTKGIVRNAGYPNSLTGIGVFCNINSAYNTSLAVLDRFFFSDIKVQLYAAYTAMKLVKRVINGKHWRGAGIQQVIIKTDSNVVVLLMVDYIRRLRQGENAPISGALDVDAKELIIHLDDLVNEVSRMGTRVRFWHCAPDMNIPAQRLAEAALYGRATWDLSVYELFGERFPRRFFENPSA